MARDKYEYKPLAPEHIRVINVLLPRKDGDIAIGLDEVPLEEAKGSYTAISYTWGSPDVRHKVWIDGQYLIVRDNIWRFFKHCSSAGYDAPDKLWVDSVSINQEDNDEKASQVTLMGDIFSKAEKVLVWLDKASEVSLSARWASSLQEDRLVDSAGAFATLEELKWIEEPAVKYRLLLAWREEVSDILLHPYWRRLWIVQEIWQGRQVLVVLGLCTVDLSYVTTLNALFFSEKLWAPRHTRDDIGYHLFHGINNEKFPIYLETHGNHSVIHNLDRLRTNRDRRTIEFLLERFGEQLCQNKRDLLYGLIGMTRLQKSVTIDYTSAIEEVFFQSLLLIQEEWMIYPDHQSKGVAVLPFDKFTALAEAMAVNLESIEECLRTLPTARACKLVDPSLRITLGPYHGANIAYMQYNQIFKSETLYDDVARTYGSMTTTPSTYGFCNMIPQRLLFKVCPGLVIISTPDLGHRVVIDCAIVVNSKKTQYWEVALPASLRQSLELQLSEAHVSLADSVSRCELVILFSVLDIFQVLDISRRGPRHDAEVHSLTEAWKYDPYELGYWTRGLGKTTSLGLTALLLRYMSKSGILLIVECLIISSVVGIFVLSLAFDELFILMAICTFLVGITIRRAQF